MTGPIRLSEQERTAALIRNAMAELRFIVACSIRKTAESYPKLFADRK